jgi:type VI secretion system secreted protein Hcp
MPIYMSLIIDGIEADGSVNVEHRGEINVESFSWGVSVSERSGAGGAGKATFDDLVIVKQVDQSSPRLMLACAQGRHHKSATFRVIPIDETGRIHGNVEVVRLEDITIEAVRQTGHEHGGALPTEVVTINFARVASITVGPRGANGD